MAGHQEGTCCDGSTLCCPLHRKLWQQAGTCSTCGCHACAVTGSLVCSSRTRSISTRCLSFNTCTAALTQACAVSAVGGDLQRALSRPHICRRASMSIDEPSALPPAATKAPQAGLAPPAEPCGLVFANAGAWQGCHEHTAHPHRPQLPEAHHVSTSNRWPLVRESPGTTRTSVSRCTCCAVRGHFGSSRSGCQSEARHCGSFHSIFAAVCHGGGSCIVHPARRCCLQVGQAPLVDVELVEVLEDRSSERLHDLPRKRSQWTV